MREKTIKVEIDERGNSSIDLTGFQGKGCADVARSFHGSDQLIAERVKREFHIERQEEQYRTELRSGT